MTKIFTITHDFKKIAPFEIPNCYQYIFVGGSKYNNKFNPNFTFDNVGHDQISEKNQFYSELTGIYQVYKNVKSNYIGFTHYRRFFIKRSLKNIFKYHLLDCKDINRILKNEDIIVPERVLFKKSVFQQYINGHLKSDLLIVRKIISEQGDLILNSFDNYFNGNVFFLGNMVIGKSLILHDYYEWLFGILFEFERRVGLEEISTRDNYQKRVFGFLSERLFGVWLIHNDIKYHEVPIAFISGKKKLKAIIASNIPPKVKNYYYKFKTLLK